jgi:hypothetical protein
MDSIFPLNLGPTEGLTVGLESTALQGCMKAVSPLRLLQSGLRCTAITLAMATGLPTARELVVLALVPLFWLPLLLMWAVLNALAFLSPSRFLCSHVQHALV